MLLTWAHILFKTFLISPNSSLVNTSLLHAQLVMWCQHGWAH